MALPKYGEATTSGSCTYDPGDVGNWWGRLVALAGPGYYQITKASAGPSAAAATPPDRPANRRERRAARARQR